MRSLQRIGTLLLLTTMFCGPVSPAANPAAGPADPSSKMAAGNNQFALDLYGRLASQPGNICFSPYSIENGEAMLYAGAGGKTAEEFRSVFHFSLQADQLAREFAALNQTMAQDDDFNAAGATTTPATLPASQPQRWTSLQSSGPPAANPAATKEAYSTAFGQEDQHSRVISPTLIFADALFVQKGLLLHAAYTDLLDRQFHSSPQTLDFADQPRESAQFINGWICPAPLKCPRLED